LIPLPAGRWAPRYPRGYSEATSTTIGPSKSLDDGTSWTKEDGSAGVEQWLDETTEGLSGTFVLNSYFEEQHHLSKPEGYLGVLYTNRGESPDYVRWAGLAFADPDEDLLSKFEAQATADLLGRFEAQVTRDLLGKFETQATAELLGKFEAQVTAELLSKAVIRNSDFTELLGKFEAQATAELLGKFEAQAIAELLGKFEAQATAELLGKFEARPGLC